MRTVPLQDISSVYNEFDSSTGTGLTKQDLLFGWCDSKAALLEHWQDKTAIGTVTRPELYRFRWGEYAALSYTWASPEITRNIFVNGTVVEAIENLEAALRIIRDRYKFVDGFKLWIDDLCMNQEDIAERSLQVAKMGKIYRNSGSVCTWLIRRANGSLTRQSICSKLWLVVLLMACKKLSYERYYFSVRAILVTDASLPYNFFPTDLIAIEFG